MGNGNWSVTLQDLIFSELLSTLRLYQSHRTTSSIWQQGHVRTFFCSPLFTKPHRLIMMAVSNLLGAEETKSLVSLCNTRKWYGELWNKVGKKTGHTEKLLFTGWVSSMYQKLSSERKPRLIHSCFNLLHWKQTILRYRLGINWCN